MSQGSPIQWCDDTVNPVMGCSAPCELRPSPEKARKIAVDFFKRKFPETKPATIREIVNEMTEDRNATEIYQLREEIAGAVITVVEQTPGAPTAVKAMAKRLKEQFDGSFICYAHQQHMFRGSDITNPDKITNPGYAPQFEQVTEFAGRVAEAAARPDLFGKPHKEKPWLNHHPRLIFVSDMADAMSTEVGFDYLKAEIVDVAASRRGSQHIWLWLTKMPKRMAEFGVSLKSQGIDWPDNLVAMTSVTSMKTVSRAKYLKAVPARFKGLSVEPLWGEVSLPLDGIDWCIVGGQSGPGAEPFDLAWARSVQRQCKEAETAFFVNN